MADCNIDDCSSGIFSLCFFRLTLNIFPSSRCREVLSVVHGTSHKTVKTI